MSKKSSRLDSREPKWWDALAVWCQRNGITADSDAWEDLFAVVIEAIQEDGAIEAASRGGVRGAAARMKNTTPEQRHLNASHAARVRWAKKLGAPPEDQP